MTSLDDLRNESAFTNCGFLSAWASAGSGKPVGIAIVDSGYTTHPAMPTLASLHTFGAPASDSEGHGTQVAGLVAAGAPGCGLHIFRVTNELGLFDEPVYHRALLEIAASDIAVVNISIGRMPFDAEEDRGIRACVAKGKTVVVSIGNSPPFGHNQEVFPASLPDVITVAATDNQGAPLDFSIESPFVWIAAPGGFVMTTDRDGGFSRVTGTSFATPIVAAACALMHKKQPGIRPSQVREKLKTLTGSATHNRNTGWGMLNIAGL